MWILFNESGDIVTSIPHGQAIRQYNPFDLYLCFPNESQFQNLEPVTSFLSGDNSFVTAGTKDSAIWGGNNPVTFYQAYVDEAVFGFIPGKQYSCYHIHVPEDTNVTENFGKLTMVVSVTIDTEETHTAKAILNVAETFGNNTSLSVSQSEYDKLLSIIRTYCAIYSFSMADGPSEVSYPIAIALYGWSNLGFINGTVAFAITAPEYSDWTTIAQCSNVSINLTANSTFFSKDPDGNDVEFRLILENGTVKLQIHAGTYAGKTISFAGVCALTTPKKIDISPDSGSTVYTIVGISATVSYDASLTTDTGSVDTTFSDASATDTTLKNVAFSFKLPKPEKGDKGDTGPSPTIRTSDYHWMINNGQTDTGVVAKGNDGVIIPTTGMFGFIVKSDGHLYLSYSGDTKPDMAIDGEGHLIYTY